MKLHSLHRDEAETQMDHDFNPTALCHANKLTHLQSILCNLSASVCIVSKNNSIVSVTIRSEFCVYGTVAGYLSVHIDNPGVSCLRRI